MYLLVYILNNFISYNYIYFCIKSHNLILLLHFYVENYMIVLQTKFRGLLQMKLVTKKQICALVFSHFLF